MLHHVHNIFVSLSRFFQPLLAIIKSDMFKADVTTLHAGCGSSQTSNLCRVASKVDESTFWRGRLTEYMEKCPYMLSHGFKVKEWGEFLKAMTVDVAVVEKLSSMCKEPLALEVGLRVGSMQDVKSLFREAISMAWQFTSTQASPSAALLNACRDLLQDASLAFPLDTAIPNFIQACVDLQVKVNYQKLCANVSAACEKVAQVDIADLTTFASAISTLQEKLAAFGPGTVDVHNASKDSMTKVVKTGVQAATTLNNIIKQKDFEIDIALMGGHCIGQGYPCCRRGAGQARL
eukprot:6490779-Amphidinium_carterae.3